jgi:hypothetical protein
MPLNRQSGRRQTWEISTQPARLGTVGDAAGRRWRARWQADARDYAEAPTSSVTASLRAAGAAPYYGYGYQFWTYPAESRRCCWASSGNDLRRSAASVALVITAAQRDPVSIGGGYGAERNALWRSIVERHGGTW